MKKLLTLLIIAFVITSVSHAVIVSVAEDAMIDSRNVDTNYGGGSYLPAYADTTGVYLKAYMKFDGSGLDTITDISSFTMYYNYGFYRQASFYLIEDADGGGDTDGWIENGPEGITWNNSPANNTSGSGFIDDATYDVTYIGMNDDAGAAYSVVGFDWDSAAAKNAVINALNTGNRVATIAISRSSTNRWAQFASKDEGVNQEMQMGVVVIPEPATMGLLAVGSVLIGRRRKKVRC